MEMKIKHHTHSRGFISGFLVLLSGVLSLWVHVAHPRLLVGDEVRHVLYHGLQERCVRTVLLLALHTTSHFNNKPL